MYMYKDKSKKEHKKTKHPPGDDKVFCLGDTVIVTI